MTATPSQPLVDYREYQVEERFLNKLLERPENEKPFMILVVGYPAKDVMVPVLSKKSLHDIATFI